MKSNDLKLTQCQQAVDKKVCAWDCCVYTDSYCLMLPGEYEAAIDLGYSISGYDIIDHDYFGGKKVVPSSKKCCVGPEMPNNHYKTLDCWFYPVWPAMKENQLEIILGSLCPLKKSLLIDLNKHAMHVYDHIKPILSDPKIHYFLSHAEMIGYEKLELQQKIN